MGRVSNGLPGQRRGEKAHRYFMKGHAAAYCGAVQAEVPQGLSAPCRRAFIRGFAQGIEDRRTAQVKEKAPVGLACRVCGCTEALGCPPDGCSWVEKDLCSACAEVLAAIKAERTKLSPIGRLAFDRGAHAAIRACRERLL